MPLLEDKLQNPQRVKSGEVGSWGNVGSVLTRGVTTGFALHGAYKICYAPYHYKPH